MTAVLLVSGALVRKPEKRVSKGGAPYLTATIRDKGGEGNSSRYFQIVTFSETCIAELDRLDDGDAVSVQGAFSLEEFEGRDGTRKQTLKIVVDHVLALRQPPKKREPRSKPERPQRGHEARESRQAPGGPDDPSDMIPF